MSSDTPPQPSTNRARLLAEQREAQKAVAVFLKGYMADRPGASGLSGMADVRLYPKRPPGFSKHVTDVLDGLLSSKQYRSWPNRKIVESLQRRYEGYKVPAGILNRRIPSNQLPAVRQMLAGHGVTIDLSTHDTLSKIKRVLQGVEAKQDAEATEVNVTVTFTPHAVIVGDRSYTVVEDAQGYRRIKVNDQKLRCDVLEALLTRG